MEKKEYDILETKHGKFQTTLTKKHLARKPWVPVNPKVIKTAIPGTVVELKVKVGDLVQIGDIVVIYKAMKMNNNIRATMAGKVKTIFVTEGQNTPSQTPMLEIE